MTFDELRRFIREETAARVVAGLRDVEREAAEYVAMMLQQGPIAPLDAFACDGSDDGADLEGFDEDFDDADEREPVRRPAAEAPAGAVSAGRGATRERGAGQAAEAPAASESARRARRGRRGRRRGKPAE